MFTTKLLPLILYKAVKSTFITTISPSAFNGYLNIFINLFDSLTFFRIKTILGMLQEILISSVHRDLQ